MSVKVIIFFWSKNPILGPPLCALWNPQWPIIGFSCSEEFAVELKIHVHNSIFMFHSSSRYQQIFKAYIFFDH